MFIKFEMKQEEEFICNGCLQEIRGNWKDKIIGLCQSCQDKFDKEIKRQGGVKNGE